MIHGWCVSRAAAALPGLPLFHRALADATPIAAINRTAQRFNYAVI